VTRYSSVARESCSTSSMRSPSKDLAGLETRRQRQARAAGERVAQVLRRQFGDPQTTALALSWPSQASARLVSDAAACCASGCAISTATDTLRVEWPQTPSEQSKKQSPWLQVAVGEIELEVAVEADRARQHVPQFRMFPDVVAGQRGADAAAQQVEPRVADMRADVTPAAQHQGSERRRHAGQFGLAAGFGHDPAIERDDDLFERVRHAPGVGRRVVVREQAAHRVFGGLTPALVAADAVGDGCDQPLVFEFGTLRRDHAAEVLVAFARTGQRGVTDVDAKRHAGMAPEKGRQVAMYLAAPAAFKEICAQIFAAVRCAAPQVVRQRVLTPVRPARASRASAAKIRKPI
jgi:hypothetical protein